MKGSENLWSDDRLLEEMEEMQNQIEDQRGEISDLTEKLGETTRELSACRREGQQLSSEISDLQSALQQARSKIQEQSAHIVKLNGADLILKENARLKAESAEARTEALNVKKDYDLKIKCLKEAESAAEEKRKMADRVYKSQKELILINAKEIADKRIKKAETEHRSEIRKLSNEKKQAVEIRDLHIFLAISVIVISLLSSIFERSIRGLNWITFVNAAYMGYLVVQLIRYIKARKEMDSG